MDNDARRAGSKGVGIGFLLGLLAAGIPLVILLLRPPPVIMVNAPAPAAAAPASAEDGELVREDGKQNAKDKGKDKGKELKKASPSPSGPGETKEDPDAPSAEDDEEGDDRRAIEHEETLRKGLRDTLQVRVTDAETGTPLPGVDIRLFVGTFQCGGCSSHYTTLKDGSVDLGPLSMFRQVKGMRFGGDPELARAPFGSVEDPMRADVTLRVPGYKAFRADATGDRLDVKLEKEGAPRPFGSITGRLLGPDEAVWSRPVVVSLQDPVVVDSIASWVFPGPDGRFELTGVPAGAWGVKIADGWGPRERVDVPSGGAIDVTLHLSAGDIEERHGLPEVRRAIAVTVGGRDFPYGAAFLLQGDWSQPILAAVQGGTASFPAVPVGAVRVVLRRPNAGDEIFTTVVAEGEGVQAVPFPAPK